MKGLLCWQDHTKVFSVVIELYSRTRRQKWRSRAGSLNVEHTISVNCVLQFQYFFLTSLIGFSIFTSFNKFYFHSYNSLFYSFFYFAFFVVFLIFYVIFYVLFPLSYLLFIFAFLIFVFSFLSCSWHEEHVYTLCVCHFTEWYQASVCFMRS